MIKYVVERSWPHSLPINFIYDRKIIQIIQTQLSRPPSAQSTALIRQQIPLRREPKWRAEERQEAGPDQSFRYLAGHQQILGASLLATQEAKQVQLGSSGVRPFAVSPAERARGGRVRDQLLLRGNCPKFQRIQRAPCADLHLPG